MFRTPPFSMPSDALPLDAPSSDAPLTRREALARERAAAAPAPSARVAAPAPVAVSAPVTVAVAAPAAPTKPSRGSSFRKNASRATAVGALLFVAGLIVSTSVPAEALLATSPTSTGSVHTSATAKGQSLTVGGADAGAIDRDGYTVSDTTQYAHTSNTFTNDPNGTIQWPFLTGVPITSPFGARSVEGCSACSTFHEGADFAPGAGTPIRSVAAGTVIKVKADDGGYGNDVWVQHDVDGKQFVSVYGHMADNSFTVVQGQQVTVGQELGLVGSTGVSTGPHLHLEIHVDGVPVDPIAWLRANAN
jgi:murein DD-endopeptidase MepM/ murein hydrolase activator NlpD